MPAEPGVAGVRLPDGRLIFVEGVPGDLLHGAAVRLALDGRELAGRVSIVPALVVWRDPAARCASFVALEHLPGPPAHGGDVPTPLATLLAPESAPGEQPLREMLRLAYEERPRLEDPEGPPEGHGQRD